MPSPLGSYNNFCTSKMQPLQLSKADSKVLAQVFDPESGPAKAEVLVDPGLPADRHINDAELLVKLKKRERDAISLIETFEASKDQSAENEEQTFRDALAILDQTINEHPDYASARNNRAQLRRWRFGDRNMICQRRQSIDQNHAASASKAVKDLKRSIALTTPERPTDAVSPAQGRLLAQAHTQLGALYYAASKDLEQTEDVDVIEETFSGWTQEMFEEEASRLFYLGGLYGNEVAKALAVHTNPHAKLCGSIVKEAMRKELAQVG